MLLDGRNVRFLADECHFQAFIVVHYKEDFLKDSLVPGYPVETGAKALAGWCALLSGSGGSSSNMLTVDLAAEQTLEAIDEKIFIMRPYVFACAKVGRSSLRRDTLISSMT
jgi:hypothetical protein